MFTKQNNNVLVENINILELVKKIETPAYIYSKRKIIENVNTLKSGLKKVDGLICFSVKANSNLNLVKILVNEGLGMDIVSGGELRKALLAGCNSKKIVFLSNAPRPSSKVINFLLKMNMNKNEIRSFKNINPNI